MVTRVSGSLHQGEDDWRSMQVWSDVDVEWSKCTLGFRH